MTDFPLRVTSIKERNVSQWRLDLESPPCWSSVGRLLELFAERLGRPPIALSDIMYMGRLVNTDVGTICLYKHRRSRRYLCLDQGGHAHEVLSQNGEFDVRLLASPIASLRSLEEWTRAGSAA